MLHMASRSAFSLLLLACFCAFVVASTVQQHEWIQQNPRITTASLQSVAYGAGRYVIAGKYLVSGQPVVVSSKDLKSWDVYSPPPLPSGTTNGWHIAYGPTAGFVAVGGQNSALISADGETWKVHEQSDIPTNQVQDLLYGNGIYLALGNGRGENVLSTDGINWKAVASPSHTHRGIFASPLGKFLAYGASDAIYSSTDGIKWELFSNISHSIPSPQVLQVSSLTVGPSSSIVATVYIYGFRAIIQTDDGKEWKIIHKIQDGVFGISYGNGVFFALTTNYPPYGLITSTDNGNSWTVVPNTTVAAFPYFRNGNWLAIGELGLLQTSQDGRTFTTHDEGITTTLQQLLSPPAASSSKFLFYLTYTYYRNDYLLGGVYASSDGTRWTVISNERVESIQWSSELNGWVGVHSNALNLTFSPDLAQWHIIDSPPIGHVSQGGRYIRSLVIQDNTWIVAVNYYDYHGIPTGAFVYSSKGSQLRTWTATFSASSTRITSVTAGTRGILVGDSSGNVHYSVDGFQWQRSSLETTSSANGYTLTYAGSQVDGFFFYLPPSHLYTMMSHDGLNWQKVEFPGLWITGIFYQEQLGGVVISLSDGSLQAWNGNQWAITDVIPKSGGVQSATCRSGQLVAVNLQTNYIFTAAETC